MVQVNWTIKEEFELFGDVGTTVLGVGYTKGPTKGIGKTYWTELTSRI